MDSHKCPITCELFCDPVIGQDGHTYERAAITAWLQKNGTSPLTRETMTIDSLRPNHTVKKMIDEFTSTSFQKHYLFKLDVDIRKAKRHPIFQAPGKTIFEAEWISKPGPPVVLLKIDGAKANREASFYVQLGCHPHIVHTFGMIENDGRSLTLAQEYATEGNLSLLLRENEFRPSNSVLVEIFLQITDAMICLADNGIVHGDLACRNVLVFRFNDSEPEENLVKLTDFGLTRASTLYSVVASIAATTLTTIPLRYAAPEILKNAIVSNYSEKSDVYSMGVLMWEACSQGQAPYASVDNDNEVRRRKLNGEILSQPDNCDEVLWNIIVPCWHQQSQSRPTFKKLQQSLLELKFRSSPSLNDLQDDGNLIAQTNVFPSVQQPLQTLNQIPNKPFTFNQTTANPSVQQPLQTLDQNPNKWFTFNHTTANQSGQQTLQTSDQNPNKQPFTFNQTPANPSVQQPLQTFTVTSSTHKQEPANNQPQASSPLTAINSQRQASSTNETIQSSPNNTSTKSKMVSDPPTPISEQPRALNHEQEESDALVSLADDSLLAKRLNTILRDSQSLLVDRNDPNFPLYALKSFQDLNLKPDLLKGIYDMNFVAPSKIQEIALPQLMGNPPRNIIAQSQSGTGKTAAFSLAIISRINPSIQSVQALILAPTFELAIQIGSVVEKMAQFLPYIQIAYALRGTKVNRGQLLTQPIVVGTPGTVEDWCYRRRVIDLSTLKICCVDEADVLIATGGFQQTCVEIVKSLNPNTCQMMLFSATYSDEVMTFAREIIHNPVVLRLKREKQALQNIRQFYIRCYDDQVKYQAIKQIWACLTVGQAMVFCRTKATSRDLAIRMANQHHSVRELTAALDSEQRADIIKNFSQGVFRVLIATNVMLRGIDIHDVSLVIHYDIPVTTTFEPDYETYLHQIGRCGRFGKLGYTFSLIGSETDFLTIQAIEQYFSHPIDELSIEAISQLEPDQ